MTLEGIAKLATARRVARMKLPYFSQLLESLAPVEVEGLGTFGVTEHLVLVYDPKVLAEWPLKKVAFVVAHEGMHVFNKHAMRSKRLGIVATSEDAWLWNIAGDSQINRILREAFGWCPDDAVLPERMITEKDKSGKERVVLALPPELHNSTTEEIFVWLKKQWKQMQPPPQAGGGQQQQEDEDGEEQSGGQQGQGGDQQPGQSGSQPGQQGKGKGKICAGHCGTGAGHRVAGEIGPEHEASRPQGAVERIIKATAIAIEQAARDKSQGTVPLGLLRDIKRLFEPPKVPWRRQLDRATRHYVAKRQGSVDYGWNGLARKQFAVGWGDGMPIMPKLFAPQIEVDFVVDTSGSMSQNELGIAMREGTAVLRALGASFWFTAIDAKVHEQKRVRTVDEALSLLKGGGGTDFRPYFRSLQKRKKSQRPQLIIFATDGYGTAPHEPPPGMHVIWLLVGSHPTTPTTPSGDIVRYGTAIECKD